MVRFTMFSGHEGPVGPGRDIYVTVFAGSELRRPPFAALVARARQQGGDQKTPYYTFLTLFGGTDLTWPTLAEECVALRDALAARTITLEDWDRALGRLGDDGGLRVHALTLFAGFDANAVPSEDKELEDLALHRHFGHLPEPAVEALLPAVGQKGVFRLAAVRQAVVAALGRADQPRAC